jgi:transposase
MKIQPRRQYSWDFKRRAVHESINSPETMRAVADRLGISPNNLQRWRSAMTRPQKPLVKNTGPTKSLNALERENRQLRKKLEREQTKNDILKKATEYFDNHHR